MFIIYGIVIFVWILVIIALIITCCIKYKSREVDFSKKFEEVFRDLSGMLGLIFFFVILPFLINIGLGLILSMVYLTYFFGKEK